MTSKNSTYGALKPANRHNECPREMLSCLTNTLPAREPHATTKLAGVTQDGIVLSSSDRGFDLLCQSIKCFTTPRSCQLQFIDDQLLHRREDQRSLVPISLQSRGKMYRHQQLQPYESHLRKSTQQKLAIVTCGGSTKGVMGFMIRCSHHGEQPLHLFAKNAQRDFSTTKLPKPNCILCKSMTSSSNCGSLARLHAWIFLASVQDECNSELTLSASRTRRREPMRHCEESGHEEATYRTERGQQHW